MPTLWICVLYPPLKSSFGVVGVKDRCAYFSCPFCYLLDKSRKKHTSWWHSRLLLFSYIRGIFLSVCGQLFKLLVKKFRFLLLFHCIWKLAKKVSFWIIIVRETFSHVSKHCDTFCTRNGPKNSFQLRDHFSIFLNTVIHFTINSKASINHEIFKALF